MSQAAEAAAPPPAAPSPLFSLAALLRERLPDEPLPKVSVVDVGAMILGEAEHVWCPLLRNGVCESVSGFEPNKAECDRLNAEEGESPAGARETSGRAAPSCVFRFLPWALGDGQQGEFRLCSAPMTSSMLEPNIPLLRRFMQLEEVTTVVQRSKMDTKRLDDLLQELPGRRIDFLKLDVQGFELAVLQGSTRCLQSALVVHTEVEFVPMYEQQPLFAEVDQFLRSVGFVFHRFASIHGRPMKPVRLLANPLQPISQQLWADAVYVRDLWDLRTHSQSELLRTALILHEIYHSYDVVHHILERFSPDVSKHYLDKLLAAR